MNERPGIGGSEVSAVLGISPFATPLDLWRAKVLREEEDETPAMRAGRRFETPILAAYGRQSGALVTAEQRQVLQDWRRYTQDGLAIKDGWETLVEVKTTAEPWHGRIPDHYAVQAAWGLDLLGLEACDFPVLEWPRDLRDFLGLAPAEIVAAIGIRVMRQHYSPALAKTLREECSRFWHEHVLPEVPPAARDLADAKRLVRAIPGKTAEMTEPLFKAACELLGYRQAIKEIAAEADRREFLLRTAAREMGDAEAFTREGSVVVTLKPETRKAHAVRESHSQPLRFTKAFPRGS